MSKLVSVELLGKFKEKQDTFNGNKFMQITDFVDNEGKIKSEKIAVALANDTSVIKMHVDSSDAENVKYYTDNDGERGETEITGEVGKIYIDLDSGGKVIYTYNGEDFIPFISDIATTEDIESLFSE